MDPFTLALGGASLLSSIIGNHNAQETANANLQFQRDQAANQQRLSTATRTDAYGNQEQYDPASNTWKTVLTPMQQAIQDAGTTEQYRSLTEDAARNRQLRTRQAQKSEDAVTPYNKAVQTYLNNPTASEGSIRDNIATLMSLAKQDSAKTNQSDIIRSALRVGAGGSIPDIIKATNDKAGADTSNTLLSARQQALQEHTTRDQARNNEYLPVIQQLGATIDDGGGNASQRFSDVPQRLDAMQNQQASGMLQALQSGASNINTAAGTAATASAKQPDFANLFKAMAANKSSSDSKKKPEDNAWDSGINWGDTGNNMYGSTYGTDLYNPSSYF